MERDDKRLNNREENLKDDHLEDKESKRYRIGMGIEFIDQNIISGPEIERVVNGIIITPDNVDDEENKV